MNDKDRNYLPVSVVCLKWGKKYAPEYVNNLYAMVKRNLTLPFTFYCITDDTNGIHPDVHCLPLIMDNSKIKGWWHKLSFFADPFYDIKGQVLTLDLDVVIVDNIDSMFALGGRLQLLKDYIPENGFNSSVMTFIAGEHSDILNDWNPAWADKRLPSGERMWGDQAWITKKRPDACAFPTEWVQSYKWQCMRGNRFEIPKGCKIVLFHGKPDPHEVLQNVGDWWHANDTKAESDDGND